MAQVAVGSRTVTEKPGLVEKVTSYVGEHKAGAIALAVLAPSALFAGLAAPSIASALGLGGGQGKGSTYALLDSNRVDELRNSLSEGERERISNEHAAVANLAPQEEPALYAPGGNLLPFERQSDYIKEALNLAIERVPYKPNAGSALEVMKNVDGVLASHGIPLDSAFRNAMGRTVLMCWYSSHADYKTTRFPELGEQNIDTPEKRRNWAASQTTPRGNCYDHAANLEDHYKAAGLLPAGSGMVVGHARPIWNRDRSVNTSPLPIQNYANHAWVLVVDKDDAGQMKICQFDPYWCAPIVQSSMKGPDGYYNYKNHYYAGPNGLSDPWAPVLQGAQAATHYPLTKSQLNAALKQKDPDAPIGSYHTSNVSDVVIQSAQCTLSEQAWKSFNMTPVALSVQNYNATRR